MSKSTAASKNRAPAAATVKMFIRSSSGRKATVRFAEHLPIQEIGVSSGRSRKQKLREALDAIAPVDPDADTNALVWPRWALGPDWRFDRISEVAKEALEPNPVEQPAKRIVRALHALEAAAYEIHQKLSVQQTEDFWQSYDVLERFFVDQESWWRDIPAEQKASVLFAGAEPGEAFRDARHLAKLYLATYLRKVRDATPPSKGRSVAHWQQEVYPWFYAFRAEHTLEEVSRLLGEQNPTGSGGPDPSRISRWDSKSLPNTKYFQLIVKLKQSQENI